MDNSWVVHTLGLPLLLLLGLGGLQCTGSGDLTEEQKKKVSPSLQPVVLEQAKAADLVTTTREDGTVAYHIFVRTDDPEALTDAGFPVNSVSGKIIVARWSVQEIREALRIPTVQYIEPAGRGQKMK